MVECRIAPVIIALLYKGGEFWVWAWVERRIRANFQPPSQVACLRRQEVRATKRSRMQGAQKAETGLDYGFMLPKFSRQILQDSTKSASAREGALTLQVCFISQLGIRGSRSSFWPKETRSSDRSTQLLWKRTSIPWSEQPIAWERKTLPALPASSLPLLPFPQRKYLVKELILIFS